MWPDARVFIYFSVFRRGGQAGAMFVGGNGGGVFWTVLVAWEEREENKKKKKKGKRICWICFGGGLNTVVRSVGNDDGRVVDV